MNTEWLTELGRKFNTFGCRIDSYNIFQVLEIESKEVLICRFLGDLLDPNGSHGCKIEFLKRFFNLIIAVQALFGIEPQKIVVEERKKNEKS